MIFLGKNILWGLLSHLQWLLKHHHHQGSFHTLTFNKKVLKYGEESNKSRLSTRKRLWAFLAIEINAWKQGRGEQLLSATPFRCDCNLDDAFTSLPQTCGAGFPKVRFPETGGPWWSVKRFSYNMEALEEKAMKRLFWQAFYKLMMWNDLIFTEPCYIYKNHHLLESCCRRYKCGYQFFSPILQLECIFVSADEFFPHCGIFL